MPRGVWRDWPFVVAGWTAVGLLFGFQNYLLNARFSPPDASLKMAFITTVPNVGVWAALSLLVLRLTRRFGIGRAAWRKVVPVHAAAACAFALLHCLLAASLIALALRAAGKPVDWADTFPRHLILFFDWNLVLYAVLVAAGSAADYYRESRERERQTLRAEARLAQARLQALKAQLHPHFLFNALNGIAELIHEDPAAAERTVLGFARLLRTLLDAGANDEVPLRQEVAVVKDYLDIEEVRFRDRLEVVWDVDPAVLPALVPCLVLQPLVDNALRHGAATRAGACRVTIQAVRDGPALRLRVTDNGPGFRRTAGGGVLEGVGLTNTRDRLRQLYGEGGMLTLADAPGGGAEATVVVPFRAAAAEAKGDGGGEAPHADR